MLRAIREIQPTWVVGENVRGLTNWNGGLVFDEVQADLEAAGYEVTPFLLPACSVNAPHRRDRIWFVAYRDRTRSTQPTDAIQTGRLSADNGITPDTPGLRERSRASQPGKDKSGRQQLERSESGRYCYDNGAFGIITYTEPAGRKGADRLCRTVLFESRTWDNWPTTEPTIRSGNDGLPGQLDGMTFSKWRNESIKGYGNAIVPQVALQIFKSIQQYEQSLF